MVDVTLLVLRSDDHNDVEELGTISLPGVPRVGDTVVTHGAVFEVRRVAWHDVDMVTLTLFSETYGYAFPVPKRNW